VSDTELSYIDISDQSALVQIVWINNVQSNSSPDTDNPDRESQKFGQVSFNDRIDIIYKYKDLS
jgi:hypothetical protein